MRVTILSSLSLLLSLASCQALDWNQTAPVPTYDAETFFKTTSVFGSSFSADESSILMTSDDTGVYNV